MQGSIRMFVGFFLVFGAVGGMDNGPAEYFYLQLLLAVVGLISMASGVKAMKQYE
jgi:hypothetical protein